MLTQLERRTRRRHQHSLSAIICFTFHTQHGIGRIRKDSEELGNLILDGFAIGHDFGTRVRHERAPFFFLLPGSKGRTEMESHLQHMYHTCILCYDTEDINGDRGA